MMDGSTLRIGVSGHQRIGDEATIEFVSQQIHELFTKFQQHAHKQGQKIIAYSAFCEKGFGVRYSVRGGNTLLTVCRYL
jgi:hypothetical protein